MFLYANGKERVHKSVIFHTNEYENDNAVPVARATCCVYVIFSACCVYAIRCKCTNVVRLKQISKSETEKQYVAKAVQIKMRNELSTFVCHEFRIESIVIVPHTQFRHFSVVKHITLQAHESFTHVSLARIRCVSFTPGLSLWIVSFSSQPHANGKSTNKAINTD